MDLEIKKKIAEDLKQSFKNHNTAKVETLRMLTAAVHNKEIEKKSKSNNSDLSEEEILEVIAKEAKKRKEAIELFIKGNRNDLAEKEKEELKILEEYLPVQMNEVEVRKVVREILGGLGAVQNFGKAMGEVMKKLKGKADAKLVSEILKDEMAGN